MSIGIIVSGLIALAIWIAIELYSVVRVTPGLTWTERLPELKIRLALAVLLGLLFSAVPVGQWLADQMGAAKQ